ncbi:hypothetical protein U0070_001454, partial [Myodes glareolus]
GKAIKPPELAETEAPGGTGPQQSCCDTLIPTGQLRSLYPPRAKRNRPFPGRRGLRSRVGTQDPGVPAVLCACAAAHRHNVDILSLECGNEPGFKACRGEC